MKYSCQTPGILNIAFIVSQGIAIITHIFALATPKWDNWQPVMKYPGTEIDIHQNLWSVTDNSAKVLQQHHALLPRCIDEEWKKPIINLLVSALGLAILSEIMLVVVATVKLCAKNKIIHIILLSIVSMCSAISAVEVIYAAMEFKRNHLQILSVKVYARVNMVPYQQYGLDNGFYVCLVSGSMYCLGVLIMITDIIKTIVIRKKTEVVPIHI